MQNINYCKSIIPNPQTLALNPNPAPVQAW